MSVVEGLVISEDIEPSLRGLQTFPPPTYVKASKDRCTHKHHTRPGMGVPTFPRPNPDNSPADSLGTKKGTLPRTLKEGQGHRTYELV